MTIDKGRFGSGPWYPEGYTGYNNWQSDDNYVGPTNMSWDDGRGKVKKKKKEEKPKAKAPSQPAYNPQASDVGRAGGYGPSSAPAGGPAPFNNTAPPAPVINFSMPEIPYQPTVMNRQTAVNNRALKIDSGYKKPKNRGGTTGFKRSKTPRNYDTKAGNASMRINKSLSI